MFGSIAMIVSSFYFCLVILHNKNVETLFFPEIFNNHYSYLINLLSGISTLVIAIFLQNDVVNFAGRILKYFSFVSSVIVAGYWSVSFFLWTDLILHYIWLPIIPPLICGLLIYINNNLVKQTESIKALIGLVNEYKGA